MTNVAVISLGCDKNRIDTEHLLFRLVRGGHSVCDIADADVIVINTCAFIESARAESIDTVLECAKLKSDGKLKKLIVTGCLPQKYRSELIQALPEVDAFLGAFEYDKILQTVDGICMADNVCAESAAVTDAEKRYRDFCDAENCGRILTTFPHTAYLKIAEGCDNKCTFCTIPSIRGGYRSRPTSDIIAEARKLADDGVKELILVAQDVTRYGSDIGSSLVGLLDELERLPVMIRLLYCYPERMTDELIQKISNSRKIVKYVDIPIQHCSDKILKTMNRKTTGASVERVINILHKNGIVVRTTLMVGFPGETQAEFDELCEFVKRVKPEYAGVFAYSKEDGTAAARLPGHIKRSEKLKRVKTLGKICTEVTRTFNAGQIGKKLRVLYEDVDFDKNMFVGRTEFQAPEVDGLVYFKGTELDVGKIYEVEITDSDDYDLYGTIGELQ